MGDFVPDEMVLSLVSRSFRLSKGLTPSSSGWLTGFSTSKSIRKTSDNGFEYGLSSPPKRRNRKSATNMRERMIASRSPSSHSSLYEESRGKARERPLNARSSTISDEKEARTKRNKRKRGGSRGQSPSSLSSNHTQSSEMQHDHIGELPVKDEKINDVRRRSLHRRRNSPGKDVISFDSCYATMHNSMGREKGTVPDGKILVNEEDSDDVLAGRALCEMGEAEASLGRWDNALELWNKALQIQRKELGEKHVVVGQTLVCRGTALANLGRLYDSILDLEKGVRIQRTASESETDGKTLLDVAAALLRVGIVHQARGNYVEALNSFEASAKIKEEVLGPNHESVARAICIMGNAYHQRRQYGKAVMAYMKGLALYKGAGISTEHPHVAWVARCVSDKNILAELMRTHWEDDSAI